MSEDEKQFVQTLITENAGLQEAYADLSHALDQKYLFSPIDTYSDL